MTDFNLENYLEEKGIHFVSDLSLQDACNVVSDIVNADAYIKIDIKDFENLCKNSSKLALSIGESNRENRIMQAFNAAKSHLDIPVSHQSKLMVMLWLPKHSPLTVAEIKQFSDSIDLHSADEVIWGVSFDDRIGNNVRAAILLT